jgi:large subunit ribosomal protein L35
MKLMKLKTHSATSKRIRRTGTGKLMRKKSGKRHLLTGKGRDRKRRLGDTVAVPSTVRLTVNRLLPNG